MLNFPYSYNLEEKKHNAKWENMVSLNVKGAPRQHSENREKMSSLNIICGKAIENSVTLLKILLT
jgi:hypothetical protein